MTEERKDASAPRTLAVARAASLPHESGHKHVSGEARYTDDLVAARGLLEVWPVQVPHAHARIVRIDAERARKAPGVRAVLLAADIPGENDTGAVRHDEPLLAHDVVSFHGQVVALVVGDSEERCRDAAALVEVEVEPLPAILTLGEAIEQESFHTEPHRIARGDLAGPMAAAPHRVAGEIEIGGQEHFYLEAHAAWAEPDEDGAMHVVSSTQHPSEVQAIVARVLHVARHLVVVESPRMGGGFGGKETQGAPWAAWAALAARATGRAVRVRPPRELDMRLTGRRHPFFARYEVGFDGDGRLLAFRAELVSNGGWSLDLSESILDRALFHVDNAYRIPAIAVEGRVAKTHLPSNTAFRGFGGPQGMVVIEEAIDRVARALDLPPEVVRERNLYVEGDATHYGQPLEDVRIGRIWARLLDTSRFAARRAELATWNEANPHGKRGLAITPVKFGISFTAAFLNQAGALVLIYQDGSVQVNHGGTEMGQGLHTKMRAVASRELGVDPARIRVMQTRTDKVPNTSATAASSGSDLNGQAVKAACEALCARLAPVAARMLVERTSMVVPPIAPERIRFAGDRVFAAADPDDAGAGAGDAPPGSATAFDRELAFADVVARAYFEQVSLSATGYYRTPGIGYDKKAGRGRPFHYFAYGAAVSEVEVCGFTGALTLREVDILHDVGSSLNEGVDRGQVEGAFIQGAGWLTMEEVLYGPDGRLLTAGPSTYKIPAIGDAPRAFRVELLPDAAQTNVIHGSKAVGEPPYMLALSVREAIKDAVRAFGPSGASADADALGCPATGEAIFWAVEAARERRRASADAAPAAAVGAGGRHGHP